MTQPFQITAPSRPAKQDCFVIVDMQPRFTCSKHVIKPVIQETERAMNRGDHIIVVEYSGSFTDFEQNTWPRVWEPMQGYPFVDLITKNNDGGENEIRLFLRNHGLENFFKTFRFVGVNFEACVKKTSTGIARYYHDANVEVIARASNPGSRGKSYDNCPDNLVIQ